MLRKKAVLRERRSGEKLREPFCEHLFNWTETRSLPVFKYENRL